MRICRKPEIAFDVFAVGDEAGETILAALFQDVRHGLAVTLYDGEIVIVHPDGTLEIALVLFDFLGCDIEAVGVERVDTLFAFVLDVVLGQFGGVEHERLNAFKVLHILRRKLDRLQCILRRIGDLLIALALRE